MQRDRIKLLHGSLMYRDKRLYGFDAATVVEVIEHLDPPRLAAFERVLFESARPGTAILTTPNVEYNVKWESLPAGKFRHKDHRFEWTRAEFQRWASGDLRPLWLRGRFLPVGPRIRPWERRRRWPCFPSKRLTITIPELSLGRADRTVRLRQVHLCAEALQADRNSVVGLLPGLVCDDENDQAATNDAFEVLHFIAGKRLAAGSLTVVDATNVQPEARKPLVELAREFHCLPVAIVLELPEKLCQERNRAGPTATSAPHVIRQQRSNCGGPCGG